MNTVVLCKTNNYIRIKLFKMDHINQEFKGQVYKGKKIILPKDDRFRYWIVNWISGGRIVNKTVEVIIELINIKYPNEPRVNIFEINSETQKAENFKWNYNFEYDKNTKTSTLKKVRIITSINSIMHIKFGTIFHDSSKYWNPQNYILDKRVYGDSIKKYGSNLNRFNHHFSNELEPVKWTEEKYQELLSYNKYLPEYAIVKSTQIYEIDINDNFKLVIPSYVLLRAFWFVTGSLMNRVLKYNMSDQLPKDNLKLLLDHETNKSLGFILFDCKKISKGDLVQILPLLFTKDDKGIFSFYSSSVSFQTEIKKDSDRNAFKQITFKSPISNEFRFTAIGRYHKHKSFKSKKMFFVYDFEDIQTSDIEKSLQTKEFILKIINDPRSKAEDGDKRPAIQIRKYTLDNKLPDDFNEDSANPAHDKVILDSNEKKSLNLKYRHKTLAKEFQEKSYNVVRDKSGKPILGCSLNLEDIHKDSQNIKAVFQDISGIKEVDRKENLDKLIKFINENSEKYGIAEYILPDKEGPIYKESHNISTTDGQDSVLGFIVQISHKNSVFYLIEFSEGSTPMFKQISGKKIDKLNLELLLMKFADAWTHNYRQSGSSLHSSLKSSLVNLNVKIIVYDLIRHIVTTKVDISDEMISKKIADRILTRMLKKDLKLNDKSNF